MKHCETKTSITSLENSTTSLASSKPLIKCCSKNIASNFCVNEKCNSSNIFVCSTQDCQCNKDHNFCLKARVQSALKLIKDKIVETESTQKYIDETIEKLIDELSEMRGQLISKVQQKMKYINITQQELNFLQFVTKQPFQGEQFSMTGKQAFKMWQDLDTQHSPQQKQALKCQNQLKLLQKKVQQLINDTKTKVERLIDKIPAIPMPEKLMQQSTIIKYKKFAERIIGVFPRKVTNFKSIFRTDQYNNDRMDKYYELCGNVNHTMIIVKILEEGKQNVQIGYTPLKFYSGKDEKVIDRTNSSFRYSSKMKKIIRFNTPKPTITRYANKKGPDFTEGFKILKNEISAHSNNNQQNPQKDTTVVVWQVIKVDFSDQVLEQICKF